MIGARIFLHSFLSSSRRRPQRGPFGWIHDVATSLIVRPTFFWRIPKEPKRFWGRENSLNAPPDASLDHSNRARAPKPHYRKLNQQQRGFTLMEMLVVLGIFATISVAVTDIFLLSTKAQRRVGDAERTQGDARSALEYLVRTVRTGTIAYDLLPNPLPTPLTSIAVRNNGGMLLQFSLSSDPLACGSSAIPCLLVTEGEAVSVTAPLTSNNVAVNDLRFFLSPQTDPFSFDASAGSYASDAQPILTVSMTVSPPGKTAQQIVLQTSVTPRQYAR